MPSYVVESWAEPDAEESTPINLTPVELTAKYLNYIKQTAESFLGTSVAGCVISEPSDFLPEQHTALMEACIKAGFSKSFAIKESVAAALSFSESASNTTSTATSSSTSSSSNKKDKTILVLDFGGHNFNVSVLNSSNGMYGVVASVDDHKLGGVELDEVVVSMVAEEFRRKHKLDVRENRRALMKLRNVAEQTKRALSQMDSAPCSVESLCEGIDYHGFVNRGKFEALAEPVFQRCAALIRKGLDQASLKPEQVSQVLLVGGCSRVPRFQSLVRSLFANNDPSTIMVDSDPDEVIARGCAIQSRIISAMGLDQYAAAIKEPSLTSTVPHTTQSLGVADSNGKFCVLIPKGTPVPAMRNIGFSNAVANQTEVMLAVLEGENEVASKNTKLADVVISDLPSSLKIGESKLEVTFLIEADKVLQVLCKEKTSGKVHRVKLIKK